MLVFVPGYGDNANFNPVLVTRVTKTLGHHAVPKKRMISLCGNEYFNLIYSKRRKMYLRYAVSQSVDDPWPMTFIKASVTIHSGKQKLILECESNARMERLFSWVIATLAARGGKNMVDNVTRLV